MSLFRTEVIGVVSILSAMHSSTGPAKWSLLALTA